MNRQSTSATSVTRTVKPIATLTAAVPQGSRELFFGQLRAFSEVNKFQITISGNAQFKNVFDIEMIRDDVWVIGDSLFDPLSYRIDFYPAPARANSRVDTTQLQSDLVQRLSGVADITVSQVR